MKYKSGDIIAYKGMQLRVRMAAVVGFEGDAPTFYDLTDLDTGKHYTIPITEIDSGYKVQHNDEKRSDYDEDIIETDKATFVEKSDKPYWDQMGDKLHISDERRKEFALQVALSEETKESNKRIAELKEVRDNAERELMKLEDGQRRNSIVRKIVRFMRDGRL